MILILLGPPGSGKGTQAQLLSKKFNIPHISTGDIFRENIKNETDLGKKAKEFMNKGLLVPDEVTNNMVKGRLKHKDCANGLILDGYPRTIAQAEFLSSIIKISRVVNFTVPKEEIIKRISGRRTCKGCGKVYHLLFNPPKKENACDSCQGELIQRDDEKKETVVKRLEVYESQTAPLVKYYLDKKVLANIDAFGPIEEIFDKTLKALE